MCGSRRRGALSPVLPLSRSLHLNPAMARRFSRLSNKRHSGVVSILHGSLKRRLLKSDSWRRTNRDQLKRCIGCIIGRTTICPAIVVTLRSPLDDPASRAPPKNDRPRHVIVPATTRRRTAFAARRRCSNCDSDTPSTRRCRQFSSSSFGRRGYQWSSHSHWPTQPLLFAATRAVSSVANAGS